MTSFIRSVKFKSFLKSIDVLVIIYGTFKNHLFPYNIFYVIRIDTHHYNPHQIVTNSKKLTLELSFPELKFRVSYKNKILKHFHRQTT